MLDKIKESKALVLTDMCEKAIFNMAKLKLLSGSPIDYNFYVDFRYNYNREFSERLLDDNMKESETFNLKGVITCIEQILLKI